MMVCKGLGRKKLWPVKGNNRVFTWRGWGGARKIASTVDIPPETNGHALKSVTAVLTCFVIRLIKSKRMSQVAYVVLMKYAENA